MKFSIEWYIISELLFNYERDSSFTKSVTDLCSHRKAYPGETLSVGS